VGAKTAQVRRTNYSSPRQQERQQRILTVVREQITAAGYDGINVRDVAAASGVALKTLYNLYGSKDELMLAAVAELLSDVQQLEHVAGAEPGIPGTLHTPRLSPGKLLPRQRTPTPWRDPCSRQGETTAW
jgi:AcrR family transcriptional regulator